MEKYQKGDQVLHYKSQKIGQIVNVMPVRGGQVIYAVLIDQVIYNCPEQQLGPCAIVIDEFDSCKQGLYSTHDAFMLSNTTYKIGNQSTNTISTMMASKTSFKPYQYIPLLKFLYSSNRRLLIADEVGLGKTIEAGHIMMELKARQEMQTAIIFCPSSLIQKWHDEMENRFSMKFGMYGADTTDSLVHDLATHSDTFLGIVNYEKLTSEKVMRAFDKAKIRFDLVICDEAHKLRNHTTTTHKNIKDIVTPAKSVIFLTATPIMHNEENLFWQLNLLDERAYNNSYLFTNALRENTPFVRALSQLGDLDNPIHKIISELDSTEVRSIYTVGDNIYTKDQTIHEKFKNVPMYQRIIEEAEKEDTLDLRVQLQADISSMNVINGIFTRNRKKQVLYDIAQPVRSASPMYINLTSDERVKYDKKIAEYISSNTDSYTEDGRPILKAGSILGLMSIERKLASSVYAYEPESTWEDNRKDAKLDMLQQIYKEVCITHNKKMIVFAVYKQPLKYIAYKLRSMGINVLLMTGDNPMDERNAILDTFREDADCHILLTSEVGSEGLDMQFCDTLVNYDLPWNPMVVEQRIGRIDRIGQQSKVLNIYNMVLLNTIHQRIYDKLLVKINIFQSCIGDLEAILDSDYHGGGTIGEAYKKLENFLYRTDISDEEKEKQIDVMQMAMITETKNRNEVSERLTDTLTNDVYFRNEINSIQRNYRYITEKELINYIYSIINKHLTTCSLRKNDNYTYTLTIPLDQPNILVNFLQTNRPLGPKFETDFRKFISKIRGEMEIKMTFHREYAAEHKNIIYIDPFNPIIIASWNYFKNLQTTDKHVYQFKLNYSGFDDLEQMHPGEYFLGIYKLPLCKHIYGNDVISEQEIPLLYDVERGCLVEGREEAFRIIGQSQQNAELLIDSERPKEGLMDELRTLFVTEIDNLAEIKLKDEQLHLESSKQMEINRLTEYYTNRIEQQITIIDEIKRKAKFDPKYAKILAMQEANLRTLQSEFEEAIQKVSSGNIKMVNPPSLISLNHILIYHE